MSDQCRFDREPNRVSHHDQTAQQNPDNDAISKAEAPRDSRSSHSMASKRNQLPPHSDRPSHLGLKDIEETVEFKVIHIPVVDRLVSPSRGRLAADSRKPTLVVNELTLNVMEMTQI